MRGRFLFLVSPFGVSLDLGANSAQMIGLLIMRERTAWWTALRTEDYKPLDEAEEEGIRRLFTVAEESEESSEHGESAQAGYGAIQTDAVPGPPTASPAQPK